LCLGFVFLVAVGLFNVISAIFVEATVDTAQKIIAKKKKQRLLDESRFVTNITAIVQCIVNGQMGIGMGESEDPHLSDLARSISTLEVTCEEMGHLLTSDPVVMRALDELDIDPEDNIYLADILDPDNGGSITVPDLITGIRRLRGVPRRSDIVTVDLMVRSLQERINELHEVIVPKQEPRDETSGHDEHSAAQSFCCYGSESFPCGDLGRSESRENSREPPQT